MGGPRYKVALFKERGSRLARMNVDIRAERCGVQWQTKQWSWITDRTSPALLEWTVQSSLTASRKEVSVDALVLRKRLVVRQVGGERPTLLSRFEGSIMNVVQGSPKRVAVVSLKMMVVTMSSCGAGRNEGQTRRSKVKMSVWKKVIWGWIGRVNHDRRS